MSQCKPPLECFGGNHKPDCPEGGLETFDDRPIQLKESEGNAFFVKDTPKGLSVGTLDLYQGKWYYIEWYGAWFVKEYSGAMYSSRELAIAAAKNNKSLLVNGKIPANTICPFRAKCPFAQTNIGCKHLGKNHDVEFSCAAARTFDMF